MPQIHECQRFVDAAKTKRIFTYPAYISGLNKAATVPVADSDCAGKNFSFWFERITSDQPRRVVLNSKVIPSFFVISGLPLPKKRRRFLYLFATILVLKNSMDSS
mmetsp:Transcript_12416/g.25746  ORF Transcript_12416/g.25746 Transcript_12416/m.25746 type:complete len:105 (-) Transcript_12416:38-352(-)